MTKTSNLSFNHRANAFAEDVMLTTAMLDWLLRHTHIVSMTDENY